MRTFHDNLLLLTDSYKFTHYLQYPPDTQVVYSYFEPRLGGEYKEVVFFGLQYFLKRYLYGQVVTKEKIDEAEAIVNAHLGRQIFNRAGWQRILKHHGGRLPILIRAVAEGTVVPENNVLMTIENTDPQCYWLTNYLETLLVQVWYGCTTATISREMKKIIMDAMRRSGTETDENVNFRLHDFGFRGVSSVESAAVGGAGHLVNFYGTDNVAALLLARNYYNEPMAGFSIPAAEHSTITAWGINNRPVAI